MSLLVRLVALYLSTQISVALLNESSEHNRLIPIVVYDAKVDHNYSDYHVNETSQYIFEFKIPTILSNNTRPARVTVGCSNATRDHPILVVLRQAKGVLSWQLPLVVPTQENVVEYYRTSRTLCPNRNYRDVNLMFTNRSSKSFLLQEPPSEEVNVYIATSSPVNVTFFLSLEIVQDFTVTDNETRDLVTISPSEPRFYQFKWSDAKNAAKAVVLRVDSDENDQTCMVVSIQNISCPVFDLEQTVQFDGYRQTVSTRGGISLTRDLFPEGFYIVLVVKGDDYDCTGQISKTVSVRSKKVTLSFQSSISYMEYIDATMAALFFYASFYVITIFLCVVYYLINRNSPDFISDTLPVQAESGDTSTYNQESSSTRIRSSSDSTATNDPSLQSNELPEDAITDEELASYDHLSDALTDRDVILSKRHLYVCDLARKNPRSLQKKTMMYVGSLLTVATFYVLPVVQLVVSSQKVLQQTGNQDLCYYNFLCSHPLGFLSDFNHVFSNIGYVLLGLLFILLVYRRDKMHCNAVAQRNDMEQYGIPQHFGLLYAMGTALMMEGVLSGCYHVCPNHSNFQFDTSFMYVIAMLCMLKIYHTRHPDINASANATFGVLAVVILVGMTGILAGTKGFWLTFSVLHVLTCLWLSGEIYYMGRLRPGFSLVQRAWNLVFREIIPNPGAFFKPKYRSRLVLLILGNMFNWALVAVVWVYHLDNSFGTYLLAVFMANLMLYTVFYIIMKKVCGEKIRNQPLCYLILAGVGWGFSLNFFLRKSTSWAVTPAQSRAFNQPCQILDFYDRHDIWHFLSAISMFFSFMALLTLDDDLTNVPRTQISVF
ncbi:SID1 transmembrane family member 1 [Frankliniella fusca]|uniref:SID1 transmembrane family member 1 n=1 Tax=Frankliniella fusca TaxID=407009 RepID=A0AAE1GRW6_9NEOP|nr:SID1 transmembrane family member 1 [Frankliniella fusca]